MFDDPLDKAIAAKVEQVNDLHVACKEDDYEKFIDAYTEALCELHDLLTVWIGRNCGDAKDAFRMIEKIAKLSQT